MFKRLLTLITMVSMLVVFSVAQAQQLTVSDEPFVLSETQSTTIRQISVPTTQLIMRDNPSVCGWPGSKC